MNAIAKELRAKLEGALIPAVPVPFDREENYRPEDEEKLVQYHAASPAHGVAVWVHTGRGLLLPPEVREAVFKRWRAGLRPDQFLIAGIGCPTPAGAPLSESLSDETYIGRALELAKEAKDLGADGFLVYAPTKFRGRPEQDDKIIEYHEAIASVGVPLLLFYLYEAAGGISYSLDLIDRLLGIEGVAGIKVATLDSVMTFQDVAERLRQSAPEVALLTGEDRFLGYTVMRGAVGALIGMGAVQPALQSELLASWREKRFARFTTLSNALDRFAETTFIDPMEGYIGRILIALARDGVIAEEAAHDPWGSVLSREQVDRIGPALEALKREA